MVYFFKSDFDYVLLRKPTDTLITRYLDFPPGIYDLECGFEGIVNQWMQFASIAQDGRVRFSVLVRSPSPYEQLLVQDVLLKLRCSTEVYIYPKLPLKVKETWGDIEITNWLWYNKQR